MMRRWVVVVGVLGVLGLLLGACGDDDVSGGPSATPTSEQVSTPTAEPESEPTSEPSPDPTPEPTPEPTPDDGVEPVTVIGPLADGGAPTNTAPQDLDAIGYVEEEFLVEGDAPSYRLVGERTADGAWEAEQDDTAPFRTRILVRRPIDPAAFSGVVLVEWLNVSSGSDGDPDWSYLNGEITREGHVWVGVSVQAVGAVGGEPAVPGAEATGGLVVQNPERYGTVEHPGDRYSWGIYTLAARALLTPDGPDPLGGLVPEQVLAVGESQSAFFLTTYINAVHPLVGLFDGFLVHSRGGAAPTLSGQRDDDTPVQIRTDLDEPVLMFLTESDLTILGYANARQGDTDTVRTWEVAGTAHADAGLLGQVLQQPSDPSLGSLLGCETPINDGPQREVLQAALHHLVAWVAEGTPPPSSPRLELADADTVVIDRDEFGNALGGIRTPPVDVPVAALSGDAAGDSATFCFLFGSTETFDADTLADLYDSEADYLAEFEASAADAVDAGFLLQPDADELVDRATERGLPAA